MQSGSARSKQETALSDNCVQIDLCNRRGRDAGEDVYEGVVSGQIDGLPDEGGYGRQDNDIIPDENPLGFKISTPEHRYNRGELYNLSIIKGTLAEEERFKINDHMVQTITMLNQLPYPKHLRNVPEIAGGHHEKMDGTGYPKRLRKEEMSLTARMMAIADIFEALTAADRPYKKPKPLSESIRIMSFMKKDQHIDPDLFDLFLQSGVYLDYAQRFLATDQIDEVDISQYLDSAES